MLSSGLGGGDGPGGAAGSRDGRAQAGQWGAPALSAGPSQLSARPPHTLSDPHDPVFPQGCTRLLPALLSHALLAAPRAAGGQALGPVGPPRACVLPTHCLLTPSL